jgi:invasion protein IalB
VAAAFEGNWLAVGRLALGLLFTLGAGIAVPVIIEQTKITQPPTPTRRGNWAMGASAAALSFVVIAFLLNYNLEMVDNGDVPANEEKIGRATQPENVRAETPREIVRSEVNPLQTESRSAIPGPSQASDQSRAQSPRLEQGQSLIVSQPLKLESPQVQEPWRQYATVRPAQAPSQPQIVYSQLVYSPWIKVCSKGPETKNKQACIITKDGRLENGKSVAIVQLFEQEGKRRALRITLPLDVRVQPGTRLIIDQNLPSQQPFVFCLLAGCMSDYPVTDDELGKMKSGQTLWVQAINTKGTPISIPLPLTDFAKVYDGQATNSNVFHR